MYDTHVKTLHSSKTWHSKKTRTKEIVREMGTKRSMWR